MELRCRAVTVAIALFLSLPASSQQADTKPAPSDMTIHTTVSRVIEDVVVTDRNGNPVRGLTKWDFSLREDDKPQTLLTFEEHDGSKPDFVPLAIPRLPSNTFVDLPSAPEQGPLFVILYDMVNTSLADQAYARRALFSYIDSKPPGTRIALFLNTDETRLLQGFTENRALLHAALTSPGPGPHLPNVFLYGANYGKGDQGTTLDLFKQLATLLKGVPGRKNLIWLSDSFPRELFPPLDSPLMAQQIKDVIAQLTRDRIALYPVDVRGVTVDNEGTVVSGALGARMSPNPEQFVGVDDLAKATGGQAEHSNNDVLYLLNKAMSAGASYYTISYSPTNRKEDEEQRNIEIRVEGTKYDLSYRRWYYALPAQVEKTGATRVKRSASAPSPTPGQNDTLYASIQHGNPMQHDLLFSAHVRTEGTPALATLQQMTQLQDEPGYFQSRRRNRQVSAVKPIPLQKYLIDYRVMDPELKQNAAQTSSAPTLEFVAAAYDADGVLLNGMINDALASKSADHSAPQVSLFRVEQEIDVPLRAVWLRIAVRDPLTNRTGAIELALPLTRQSSTPASQSRGSSNP